MPWWHVLTFEHTFDYDVRMVSRVARRGYEGHACLNDVACVEGCPDGPDTSWISDQEPPEGYDAHQPEDDELTVYVPGPAPTPELLLARARRACRAKEAAARDELVLAVAWAHAHPALDKDGHEKPWQPGRRPRPVGEAALGRLDPDLAEAIARVEARLDAGIITAEQAEHQIADLHDWHGIPPVAWGAPASFAAAIGSTTYSGKLMIRDALITHHRLPKTWDRFTTAAPGEVLARRIRQVAQLIVGRPADVCRAVDAAVAPIIATAGPVTLDHAVREVITALDVEIEELEAEEGQDSHRVTLDDADAARTGTGTLEVRGDVQDLKAFNTMVGLIAELLKQQGSPDPLGARRARAVGILADPHRAAALLDGTAPEELPKPRRETHLYVHIPLGVLVGLYVMGRCEALGPVLEALIRTWCGRTDTHLVVRPVIDLDTHHHSAGYQPSETLRDQVVLTNPTCVFPYCNRRSRTCDQDHIVPHGDDGPTCSCNLAPLCRHHHNLKTHAGWTYTRIEETTFLWTDPHGLTYLRDRHGTRPLTDHGQ